MAKHYRVYHLVADRIVKATDIEADNDTEAVTKAEADPECPVCEVWTGTRRVKKIG